MSAAALFADGEIDIQQCGAVHGKCADQGAEQEQGTGGIVKRIVPVRVGLVVHQGGYIRGYAEQIANSGEGVANTACTTNRR